jgi:serine/threonine protein kinase
MGLIEGNLTSLVECGVFEKGALAVVVFEHTLRGLKRLAEDRIIHRDIKPDIILYTTKNNVYHFKIGDFGIANYEVFAETLVVTRIYLAPEMNPERGEMVLEREKQTHKIDVWSLYVTMFWALNINGFRSSLASKRFRSRKELQKAIESTRSDTRVRAIRAMAEVDPVKRAAAADMLNMLFGDYKKPETTLTCNNIDSLKTRVEEPFRLPVEKRPLHIPKAEKNRINRKRRQAPLGRSIWNKFPGAFPVGIGQ